MIIGLQIVAILFSFCMIYFAVLGYKKKELSKIEIYSWILLWAGTLVIVVFPRLLRSFSMTFLVTRVFDFMVICGFIVVLTLVSSAYLKTKKLEKKIEELVRKDAIKNVKTQK
jgi:hypothetical protein